MLEDIRRRKFILYENAEHQKDKSEEDEDILYKMCLVQQEFMFLFANNDGDWRNLEEDIELLEKEMGNAQTEWVFETR